MQDRSPWSPAVFLITVFSLLLTGFRSTGTEISVPRSLPPVNIDSEYHCRFWRKENGLPDNTILSILQTRDGYLWLGTRYGLSRFDGQSFTTFSHLSTAAFLDDKCNCLAEDSEGALWIGTDNGLLRLKAGQFTRFTVKDGLFGNRILCLYQTPDGEIWLGTENGLNRIKNGEIEKVPPNPGSSALRVQSILQDVTNRFWIGTDTGLYLYELQSKRFFRQPDPPNRLHYSIDKIESSVGGELWILAHKINETQEVLEFSENGWKSIVAASDMPCVLAGMHDKSIWVQTEISRTIQFQQDTRQELLPPRELNNRRTMALCQDQEGNIWLGTEECGLLCLKKRHSRIYTTADGLPNDDIWSVSESPEGVLWVGSDGGVSRYNDGKFFNFTQRDGLSENNVRSLSFDRSGRLWVATRTSLAVLQSNQFKSYSLLNEYPLMRIRTIRGDLDDAVLIGTDRGIIKFRPETKTWSMVPLLEEEIHSFASDSNGKLWLADSNRGLREISGNHSRLFKVADGLMADSVRSVFIDSHGDWWIGTISGLNKLIRDSSDSIRFISYPETSGLEICSMLEDNRGFLWLGSAGGIHRIAISQLNSRAQGSISPITIPSFNESDDPSGIELRGKKSQPAACKTRDGHLWFATTGGLAMIEPDRIADGPSPPPLIIEKVIIDGQDIAAESQRSFLDLTLKTPTANQSKSNSALPKIGPGRGRFLEFHYTAIALTKSDSVRFKYRLAGYEQQWHDAGDRRIAYFTNIRPGKYKFEASACYSDGIWQKEVAQFAFTLVPFFYQTLWFQTASVSFVALLVLGMHAWRLRYSAQIQKLKYASELAAQRERTGMQLHDDLGSDLAQIGRLLEMAQGAAKNPEVLSERLQQIQQVTDHAKSGISHSFWVLKPGCDNLDSLAGMIVRHAGEFFEPWDLRLRFDIPENLPAIPLSPETRNSFFLAVKETFNNIARHAHATEVYISLAVAEEDWTLTIQDNGSGFDLANSNSSGNGLNNIKKRINALSSHVQFLTSPGNGTIVVFTMKKEP